MATLLQVFQHVLKYFRKCCVSARNNLNRICSRNYSSQNWNMMVFEHVGVYIYTYIYIQSTSRAVHRQHWCGPSPIEPRQRCAFYVLCVLKHFYVCWNYSFTWRNMMVSEHGGLYMYIYMYLYIYIYTCICLYIDTSADRCGHIVEGFPTFSKIF